MTLSSKIGEKEAAALTENTRGECVCVCVRGCLCIINSIPVKPEEQG